MTDADSTPRLTLSALAAACAATLAIAGTAGGASAATGDGSGSGGATFGQSGTVVGGPALYSRPGALLGGTLHLRGAASPGAQVALERRDPRSGAWIPVASTVTDGRGAYVARWRTDAAGVFAIRLAPAAGAARAAQLAPSITVTVFRPATATWYGPGLYGRRTACGQRLTPSLVGVAHRDLPCGRIVNVLYGGRTIAVPVVDRGPFHRSADWDLTAAAARQLGLTKTSRIGAMPAPAAATVGER